MIRKTILGLGLCGLLNGSAQATDVVKDTGYSQMSLGELTKTLQEKTVVLNDFNFKKEVLDYGGAALVLFYSTCNQTQNADTIDRNMELVYLQLADKFQSAQVNNFPLKFTSFDGCKYKNNAKILPVLHVTTTETHMYLDGREIDRRRGGPLTEDTIPNSVKACLAWIDSNLLGRPYVKDSQDMRVVYNGEGSSTLVPYSKSH